MKVIDSVGELLQYLKELEISEDTFYRGHANHEWKLIPSIFRQDFQGTEHQFYVEMRQHNPTEFEEKECLFDQLALMQHYSIPTRLLDWTKNPLIALYFATDNYDKIDGEIIIYTPKKTYYSGMYAEKVLSKLVHASNRKLFSLESFKNLYIDSCKVSDFIPNEQSLESLISRVILVKPRITNKRLRAQQGCFTLHGNVIKVQDGKKYINILESSIDTLEEDILCRVRINHIAKLKIREELDILGINAGTLFPDLENYAKFLKEKLKITTDVLAEVAIE